MYALHLTELIFFILKHGEKNRKHRPLTTYVNMEQTIFKLDLITKFFLSIKCLMTKWWGSTSISAIHSKSIKKPIKTWCKQKIKNNEWIFTSILYLNCSSIGWQLLWLFSQWNKVNSKSPCSVTEPSLTLFNFLLYLVAYS